MDNIYSQNIYPNNIYSNIYSDNIYSENIYDSFNNTSDVKDEHNIPIIKATKLNISNQSAYCNFNIHIADLYTLSISLKKFIMYNDDIIHGIYFYDNMNNILVTEGDYKKPKKNFPNNLGIWMKSPLQTKNKIYARIFNNKKDNCVSITIVGFIVREDCDICIEYIKRFLEYHSDILNIKTNIEIDTFRITLINSNFSISSEVDRNKVFYYFKNYHNELFSSYDSATSHNSPQIAFYFNKNKKKQNGICECENNICILDKISKNKKRDINLGCIYILAIINASGCITLKGSATRIFEIEKIYYLLLDIIQDGINHFYKKENKYIISY